MRGEFQSPASLAPGVAAVATSSGLAVVELRSGGTLVETPAGSAKPLVHRDGARVTVRSLHRVVERGRSIPSVVRVGLEGVGSRKPEPGEAGVHGIRFEFTNAEQPPELVELDGRRGTLLLACDQRVRTGPSGGRPYVFFGGPRGSVALPAMVRHICVVDGWVYGVADDGALVQQMPFEPGRAILPRSRWPAGAVDAPVSSAGGVLLLGNWALDLDTSRVLWTSKDLDPAGVLVPVADGACVYVHRSGDLVCVGDRRTGVEALAAEVGGLAAPAKPTLPGSGDAVILEDGSRHPGTVAATGGSSFAFVAARSEAAVQLPRDAVAAIERSGSVEVIGAPYALTLASLDALERALAEDLAEVFGTYARRDLLAEAKRVATEVAARGLPADEVRALRESLVRRTESVKGNRDRQLAGARRDEAGARDAALERLLAVVDWIAAQGHTLEASAVLASAESFWPAGSAPDAALEAIRERAKPLIPATFTAVGLLKPEQRWLAWAREVAPAGAEFFDLGEIEDLAAPWTRQTIGIRTPNITLLSRSKDPAIVGACLRHAEGAVRTLQRVLREPPGAASERLEVRLHRSRRDYLSEDLGPMQAAEWSLGFYSQMHRASRFHVPSQATALHQGRQLHEVVAHEVTHQFIAERWGQAEEGVRRTPVVPGFWVVEGFARFIEDQSLEAGRRGQGFDDPTVQSVESAAALVLGGAGYDFASFLSGQQFGFHKLGDDPIGTIELKSTLVRITHTPKSAFYDQAGALVFFLMNRCGDEGRARFIAALGAHYRGETQREIWEALGYSTAGALEEAFHDFLRAPAD